MGSPRVGSNPTAVDFTVPGQEEETQGARLEWARGRAGERGKSGGGVEEEGDSLKML